jgi:hypothetical protein
VKAITGCADSIHQTHAMGRGMTRAIYGTHRDAGVRFSPFRRELAQTVTLSRRHGSLDEVGLVVCGYVANDREVMVEGRVLY